MNILDENIPKNQRQLLEKWRIHVRQIGINIGRMGMQDEEIIPFLLQLKKTTFFTRDQHFYDPILRHAKYCLVYLAVDKYESAIFIRRILRHPDFVTKEKRMSSIIKVTRAGISVWRLHKENEFFYKWV